MVNTPTLFSDILVVIFGFSFVVWPFRQRPLKQASLTDAFLATAWGVVVGPQVTGWLPIIPYPVLEQLTAVVIAIQVMQAAHPKRNA